MLKFWQRPFYGFAWDHPTRRHWRWWAGVDPIIQHWAGQGAIAMFAIAVLAWAGAVSIGHQATPGVAALRHIIIFLRLADVALVAAGVMGFVFLALTRRSRINKFHDDVDELVCLLGKSPEEVGGLVWEEAIEECSAALDRMVRVTKLIDSGSTLPTRRHLEAELRLKEIRQAIGRLGVGIPSWDGGD